MTPAKHLVGETVDRALDAVVEHPGRANLFALYALLVLLLGLGVVNNMKISANTDRLTTIEALFGDGSVIELRVRVLVLEREISEIRRSHEKNSGNHKGD